MNSLYKVTQYAPALEKSLKWIVSKDFKRCSLYACQGSDETAKNKITVDGRKVTLKCHFCGKVTDYQAREYIEERPCADCGYMRKVRVSIYNPAGKPPETHARNLCKPCELDRSAASHVAQARALRAKAEKLRADRRPNEDVEP